MPDIVVQARSQGKIVTIWFPENPELDGLAIACDMDEEKESYQWCDIRE